MSFGFAGKTPWFFGFNSVYSDANSNQFEIANALFNGFFSSFFFGLPGRDIEGDRGDETIFGSIFSDTINARGGDDTIFALSGDDFVRAGAGDDTVFAGIGDDDVRGGRGDDTLFGGLGDDVLRGGRGDDVIDGGAGENTINGGQGLDTLALSGDFSDYTFEFLSNGRVIVEGNGAVNTVRNVEQVRALRGDEVETVDIAYTLQILHASDLEGGVDAIGRAPNFAALVESLEGEFENSILLSAGDNYIPGPFFNAAADRSLRTPLQEAYQELFGESGLDNIREASGRVDITIMNILGFDAAAVGNHEFDAGPDAFATIIEEDVRGDTLGDIRWLGSQFPYLSANLDFSGEGALSGLFTSEILDRDTYAYGPDEALAGAAQPRIAPATIIEEGGEQIGVVGATTQTLASITSTGGVTGLAGNAEDMAALAAVLQPVVDDLTAQGVNKIILVSHLQRLSLEQELATLLNGVDVIIAGGSDTLLADGTDVLREGDEIEGAYPVVATDAGGGTTLIVSTDGEYSYLGRLVVDFDPNGNVIVNSLDESVNGAFATTDEVVVDVTGAASAEAARAASQKAVEVEKLTDAVDAVVSAQDGLILGETDVFIEGRREQVRTEETNLGNLTADANLAAAQEFDSSVVISLKNGGGIRAAIGEIDTGDGSLLPPQANPDVGKETGDISQLDIVNALRFNNGLTLLDLSYADLKEVLEHGVELSGPGETPGRFPQVAGVKFSFDPTAAAGSRIVDVVLDDGTVIVDGGVTQPQGGAPDLRIVTLDFLANEQSDTPGRGGDGYPFPALGENVVQLESVLSDAGDATFAAPGSEQDALAEFLLDNFPPDGVAGNNFDAAETAPADDQRIVNLSVDGVSSDPFGLDSV